MSASIFDVHRMKKGKKEKNFSTSLYKCWMNLLTAMIASISKAEIKVLMSFDVTNTYINHSGWIYPKWQTIKSITANFPYLVSTQLQCGSSTFDEIIKNWAIQMDFVNFFKRVFRSFMLSDIAPYNNNEIKPIRTKCL